MLLTPAEPVRDTLEATPCPACLSIETHTIHRATERMYGMGGTFPYAECGSCGTLWLTEIPDLKPFYPAPYYAFAQATVSPRSLPAKVVSRVLLLCNAIVFERTLRDLGFRVSKATSMLDVGCGAGLLLRGLQLLGYKNASGVDLFLPTPIEEPVKIANGSIAQVAGTFDLVMLHHSLEHMPDSETILTAIRDRLAPGGAGLVRIPIVNYAWKRYGTRWVSLDAPRHVVLFSVRGFSILANRVGLRVEKIVYDSTAFQFWGSELYLRDRPLHGALPTNPFLWVIFRLRMRLRHVKAAARLNKAGEGDQAAFLLRRS